MRQPHRLGALPVLFALAACGSERTTPLATAPTNPVNGDGGGSPAPPPDAAASLCVPGASVACVGPGGCATSQVCNPDGSSYGSCTCAPTDAAAPPACVPGASIACAGSGGCAGDQICNDAGTAYGSCACAPVDAAPPPVCVPGASIGCVGPGGCAANQVCNPAGNGYGTCTCAPTDAAAPPVCVPGASIACAGSGGCSGNQVCNDAGSAYDPCTCAPVDAAPPPVCVPGESIGCVGPGGCVANQVCNAEGSGYAACACSDAGTTLACVPGQSIACAGPNGCSSFQVCMPDGSGYAACECPDAGDDAAVAWTPAQLPGLALWLDETSFVQDPKHPGYVVHWLDRSGNGNIATLPDGYFGSNVLQGSTIDPQVLNGHDALLCGGDGNPTTSNGRQEATIAESSTLDWGTGDFAVIAVLTPITDASWFGNGVTVTSNGATSALSAGSQSVSESTGLSGFHIVAARGQSLYLNAAGHVITGATNTTALSGGVYLCAYGQEVAEVIAVKGTLSDNDLAQTLAYLQAKFRL